MNDLVHLVITEVKAGTSPDHWQIPTSEQTTKTSLQGTRDYPTVLEQESISEHKSNQLHKAKWHTSKLVIYEKINMYKDEWQHFLVAVLFGGPQEKSPHWMRTERYGVTATEWWLLWGLCPPTKGALPSTLNTPDTDKLLIKFVVWICFEVIAKGSYSSHSCHLLDLGLSLYTTVIHYMLTDAKWLVICRLNLLLLECLP